MKKFFYSIMVTVSAFFLVFAGLSEKQALNAIPDLEQQ